MDVITTHIINCICMLQPRYYYFCPLVIKYDMCAFEIYLESSGYTHVYLIINIARHFRDDMYLFIVEDIYPEV